jgi:hypothetical protein
MVMYVEFIHIASGLVVELAGTDCVRPENRGLGARAEWAPNPPLEPVLVVGIARGRRYYTSV